MLAANVRTRTILSPPDFKASLSPTYWEHNANMGKNYTLPYPPIHTYTV